MANNKHQKLLKLVQKRLRDIDTHHKKVSEFLNLIQFYFYEKKIIIGRPVIAKQTFQEMIKSHYVGLQHFSLSLKDVCNETPWFGRIIGQAIILKSQIVRQETMGKFTPWGVIIRLPEEELLKLKASRLETLIYCPSADEISDELQWFENDKASDSLTHQFLTIGAHFNETNILNHNLQKNAFSIFDEAVINWKKNSLTDDVAINPRNLEKTDFTPTKNQTIELAYESTIKSNSKHRSDLCFRYKVKLEHAIFDGLSWNSHEKFQFLDKKKRKILGLSKKKSSEKKGRWEQNAGIDCYTSAQFIEYFLLKFIGNPLDFVSAEIACILWVLVWCAKSSCNTQFTVEEVRNLTSKQVMINTPILEFKNTKLRISKGLHELLICFCGKGTGDRATRLFQNIDKKTLERALKKTSKEILPKKALPVLPASFLISPHLQEGIRVNASDRAKAKNIRELVPIRHKKEDILRVLKNN